MDDPSILRHGLRLAHLRLLAALAEGGALGTAAARIGVTQPVASRLLGEAERIVGRPLHRRAGRSLQLTPEGEAFALRAARALAEIAGGEREVEELARGTGGRVRIGSVTGPALDRVLPALRAARERLPGVAVEVEVAPSDPLADLLLAGRLDFALARLPEGRDPALFDLDPVGTEPVSLLVRQGHRLAGAEGMSATDLMDHDWILPGQGALLRRTVLDRLAALGLPAPPGRHATSSFLLTLALLQDSDAIAPVASAVAARFAGEQGGERDAGFAVLPLDLGIVVPSYGVLTLRGARLTPAAARLRDLVRG